MSFFDRLLGRRPSEPTVKPNTLRTRSGSSQRPAQPDPDALAVERYRYLLRTAPPDQLEAAHAEAFARLTPEQRAIVRRDLEASAGPGEVPASDEPGDLARAATRAEVRAPGTLERSFANTPAASGMRGSFLETFAAVFIGTTIAQSLFGGFAGPVDATSEGAAADESAAPEGDAAGADAGDTGDVGDFGDFGGGFGDFGGFDI